MMNNDNFNAYKCSDLTAHQALENIDEERRVKKLVTAVLYTIDLAGYDLEGRLVLRNKRNGKVWR